jgi:hypothetical protein
MGRSHDQATATRHMLIQARAPSSLVLCHPARSADGHLLLIHQSLLQCRKTTAWRAPSPTLKAQLHQPGGDSFGSISVRHRYLDRLSNAALLNRVAYESSHVNRTDFDQPYLTGLPRCWSFSLILNDRFCCPICSHSREHLWVWRNKFHLELLE